MFYTHLCQYLEKFHRAWGADNYYSANNFNSHPIISVTTVFDIRDANPEQSINRR